MFLFIHFKNNKIRNFFKYNITFSIKYNNLQIFIIIFLIIILSIYLFIILFLYLLIALFIYLFFKTYYLNFFEFIKIIIINLSYFFHFLNL